MTAIKPSDSVTSNSAVRSSEKAAASFYDRWMQGRGPFGAVGRLIFGVSGDFYARPFIRAGAVTASDRVLEVGCALR